MDGLGRVYLEAVKVINERGYCGEYSYVSGAPVDLAKAIGDGRKRAGYGFNPCPIEVIREWQGVSVCELGERLDKQGAVKLLVEAARESGVLRSLVKVEEVEALTEEQKRNREKYDKQKLDRLKAQEEILCGVCGKVVPRSGQRGRPRKVHEVCKDKEQG